MHGLFEFSNYKGNSFFVTCIFIHFQFVKVLKNVTSMKNTEWNTLFDFVVIS